MSISSTVKKFMPYLKTAKDYVLYRLSSQAVEMDDGTTLEQKVTSLNSLISKKLNSANVVNNLTTTNSGYALDARQGKALNDSITSLNSALENVESGYLKRYSYNLTAGQKAINIILPSTLTEYAYLPFMIIMGNSIAFFNISGPNVSVDVISNNGVTSETVMGANISVSAANENNRLRVKCLAASDQLPISVYCLRSNATITSAYGAAS